jgi:serine phosphatase RsbU (regulator of sigma subunit)
MQLRTKLILAFVVLSVLPLAGITIYAYASSLRAFRTAVEEEAREMTREMNDRMELVTAELDDRIDRLGELPYEVLTAGENEAPDTPEADRFVSRLMREMGDSARLVEALEFIPREAPAPPAEGEAPAAPPGPGGPMVIQLSGLWALGDQDAGNDGNVEVLRMGNTSLFVPRALMEGKNFELHVKEPVDVEELLTSLGVELDEEWSAFAAEAAEAGLEIARQMAERADERHRVEVRREIETARGNVEGARPPHPPRLPLPGDFGTAVRRGGEVVGNVRAKVDAGRVLLSVLSRTRTDQGELPFAVDREGQIYALDDEAEKTLRGLGLDDLYDAPETAGPRHPSDNWVVVTQKAPELGVTFGIARPVGDSLGAIRRATGRNFGVGLALVALAMFGVVPLSTRMTRHLTRLSEGVDRLAQGNLDTRVEIGSRDEIGRLGSAFNHMAGQLAENQRKLVHQERLRKELEMCRQIQEELLPRRSCRLPFAEVRALTIPAREVGGDFFNYFALPDGSVALLMGDVSGKGVPAALLMANLQATLRARLPLEADLSTLASRIDSELEATTPAESYLTLFVAVVTPDARRMRYVNAGHNTQYVCRTGGEIEPLASTGRPLGLLSGGRYEERTLELATGDAMCLFTDGLIEAENRRGEEFGAERLESLLRDALREDPGAVVERIEAALTEHRGRTEAADDATVLVLRLV